MAQTTVARRTGAVEHALDVTRFERCTRGFSNRHASGPIHDRHVKHGPVDASSCSFAEVSVLDAAILLGQGEGIMTVKMVKDHEKAGQILHCFEPPQELTVAQNTLLSPEA
ncbi:hypothetical protein [Cognatishimia sp. F0-27]|uniref:hypothetical protein n=1 Tax=Cognatishimia sp. F0-27 TaxID=2816855 RepID=UPI001D0C55DE|nr:hypothetical protein [Cognatishimia sp. F0-27]MCC1490980.1 hypothetical protein [Cognatishimia sp. F0-27]